MSSNTAHEIPDPIWWVAPGDTDWLAWGAIITIGATLYLVVSLYAKFDQWAEHKSEGTPLAKTIPTLLGIALLYEIFPLDHFSNLLPLTAILLAVMADWMAAQAKHDLIGVDDADTVLHEEAPVDAPDTVLHEVAPVDAPVDNDQSKPKPATDDEPLAENDDLASGADKNA